MDSSRRLTQFRRHSGTLAASLRGPFRVGRGASLRSALVAVVAGLVLAVLVITHISGRHTSRQELAARVGTRGSLSAEEERLLSRAEFVLTRECMSRAGFRLFDVSAGADGDLLRFPYGVDDVAWAARNGYGSRLEEAHAKAAEADPNARFFRSLSPARQRLAVAALNGGRPSGLSAVMPNGMPVTHSDLGCVSEARRRLYGDLPGWFASLKIVENLPQTAIDLVMRDAAYLRVSRQWSACMARSGYDFRTPADSRALALDPTAHLGWEGERRQAVTEAGCLRSTGLVAVARALERRVGADLATTFASSIELHRRLQIAALDRARAVVSS